MSPVVAAVPVAVAATAASSYSCIIITFQPSLSDPRTGSERVPAVWGDGCSFSADGALKMAKDINGNYVVLGEEERGTFHERASLHASATHLLHLLPLHPSVRSEDRSSVSSVCTAELFLHLRSVHLHLCLTACVCVCINKNDINCNLPCKRAHSRVLPTTTRAEHTHT